MSLRTNFFNKVFIAADHRGKDSVSQIVDFIEKTYEDISVHVTWESFDGDDYPLVAHSIAKALKNTNCGMGIILCGSGIGVTMAANRYTHLRAAMCSSTAEAKLAREHEDANVLTMGTWYTPVEIQKDIIVAFIKEPFEGGRHARRLYQMTYLHTTL
jgi:ribose 5-phosphate isomerase B